MSLASARPHDPRIVPEPCEKGGPHDVERPVKEKEAAGGIADRKWFHWIAGTEDISRALEVHKRIRPPAREEAANLG